MEFVFEGNPTPLSRPRFYQGRVVDENKDLKEYLSSCMSLRMAQEGWYMFTGPVSLEITFYMKIPK